MFDVLVSFSNNSTKCLPKYHLFRTVRPKASNLFHTESDYNDGTKWPHFLLGGTVVYRALHKNV